MSLHVGELIDRSDAILKKYEKYMPDSKRRASTGDVFKDEYNAVMDRIQDLQLKAEAASTEGNRALRAALGAEVRRGRAVLADTVLPALEALAFAQPKRKKGEPPLSREAMRERREMLDEAAALVAELGDAVATGSAVRRPARAGAGPSSAAAAAAARGAIVFDERAMADSTSNPTAYKHTVATEFFTREAAAASARQDLALESIEQGLSTLKEIGAAMGEEVERQDVLLDEVGAKMDSVTAGLSSNNARLKGLVTKVRSSRKFFIDLILIVILLAVGLYLFNMLK